MHANFAILADSATISVEGKLTLTGIFERIFTRVFPCQHPDLTLAVNIEGTAEERGEHQGNVQVRDASGKSIKTVNLPVVMRPTDATELTFRAGIVLRLLNLRFEFC